MITEKIVLVDGTEAPYNAVQQRLLNVINSDDNLIILPLTPRRSGTTTLMYNVAMYHILNAFLHYNTHDERRYVVIASISIDKAKHHYKIIMSMIRAIFKSRWSSEDISAINRLVLFSAYGYYGIQISNVIFFDMPPVHYNSASENIQKLQLSFSKDVKILINVVQ